jgi:hypothetical protein
MKICSWCGKQCDDDAAFCPKCGGALMSAGAAGPRKSRTPMYVGVSIIAFVAVVAIAMASVTYSNGSQTQMGVAMSVRGTEWANSTEHAAPAGMHYLVVTASLANGRAEDVALSPAQFILHTSDGGAHVFSPFIESAMPRTIGHGMTATVTLVFAVPDGTAPSALTMVIIEGGGGHVRADI